LVRSYGVGPVAPVFLDADGAVDGIDGADAPNLLPGMVDVVTCPDVRFLLGIAIRVGGEPASTLCSRKLSLSPSRASN
jgi:hypothetical protein